MKGDIMEISCAQGAEVLVRLAKSKGRRLTPLQVQKILYFANMLYIGENGNTKSLIRNKFLTWKYGPVVRELYERLKRYEGTPVSSKAFIDTVTIMDGEDKPKKIYEKEFEVLKKAYEIWGGLHAWELVEISHWEEGAWQKSLDKKRQEITDDLIWDEYNSRN